MQGNLGTQILIELKECPSEKLNDIEFIRETMEEAARKTGSTIISSSFRYFEPQGISGVVMISESHLTIHTWPEYGYAAADIFTCGDQVFPWKGVEFLEKELEAKFYSTHEIKRGMHDGE
ncbi:MAG: adenosylmethionine decarboxylase [Candidatus Aminicenantes bacterium]|nr:adenosylmethionine decarboxylase [Candidatus Aminicenantes bacterium]